MKAKIKQKIVMIVAIVLALLFATLGIVLLSINGCKERNNDDADDFAYKAVLESEIIVGYSISKYYGNDKNVIIPLTYSNLPIIQIEDEAFLGKTFIKQITLPETLRVIKARAFKNNTNLTNINLPANLSTLSESAFENCTNLSTITFKGDNITGLSKEVFKNCSSLTSLILPESLTSIGEYAMQNCSNLTEIYVPSGVNMAVSNVISGCDKLTNIFYNCTNIGQIPIANTLDKVLYYSENQPLEYPVQGASYFRFVNNLPVEWQIEEIDVNLTFTLINNNTNYEVSSCDTSTQSVIIPKRYNGKPVVSISANAFSDCNELTNIVIGKDITFIGRTAFSDCVNLSGATFINPNGWLVENTDGSESVLISEDLSDTSIAAICLNTTFNNKNWKRN